MGRVRMQAVMAKGGASSLFLQAPVTLSLFFLAIWFVHGVGEKTGSLVMEMRKKGTCPLLLVHLMTVRYHPLLPELTTLHPALSPPKLYTAGVVLNRGDFGRLGHGNSSDLFIPRAIRGLNGLEIKQIACGDSHCLAITGDGEVRSWGRNQNGQLGLGHTEDVLVPNKVAAFEGIAVKMLAAGAEHTAAVTENGKLFGWGWGRYGNLGLGDRNDRLVPGEVAAVPGETMNLVACGWRHTIAVADSGNLYTFGWSKYGQLGHGDFEDHLVPFQVQALKNKSIQAISGGWRHTVALDEDGQLYGWGWNKFGQVGCGNNDDQNSPKAVVGIDNQKVTQVSCGWRHTVAITDRCNLYSWGRGTSGQLGHGDAVDRCVPKRIELLSADGLACQEIERSPSGKSATSNWVSPAERYAVVPDETMVPLTNRLHQANHSDGDLLVPGSSIGSGSGASLPDSDTKRLRTGH